MLITCLGSNEHICSILIQETPYEFWVNSEDILKLLTTEDGQQKQAYSKHTR